METTSSRPEAMTDRIMPITPTVQQITTPAPVQDLATSPAVGNLNSKELMFYLKASATQLRVILQSAPVELRSRIRSNASWETILEEIIRLRHEEDVENRLQEQAASSAQRALQKLILMSSADLEHMADSDLPALQQLMNTALLADSSLVPGQVPQTQQATLITALKWQLKAHRAATQEDVPEHTDAVQIHEPAPQQPLPHPTRVRNQTLPQAPPSLQPPKPTLDDLLFNTEIQPALAAGADEGEYSDGDDYHVQRTSKRGLTVDNWVTGFRVDLNAGIGIVSREPSRSEQAQRKQTSRPKDPGANYSPGQGRRAARSRISVLEEDTKRQPHAGRNGSSHIGQVYAHGDFHAQITFRSPASPTFAGDRTKASLRHPIRRAAHGARGKSRPAQCMDGHRVSARIDSKRRRTLRRDRGRDDQASKPVQEEGHGQPSDSRLREPQVQATQSRPAFEQSSEQQASQQRTQQRRSEQRPSTERRELVPSSVPSSASSSSFPIPLTTSNTPLSNATRAAIHSLNFLFLGPQVYLHLAKHNNFAAALRAQSIVSDVIRENDVHAISRTSQANPTVILANLPSYLWFHTLCDLFKDPDTALPRGIFQRIAANSIDLPDPRSPPTYGSETFWIRHLPDSLQHTFMCGFKKTFLEPLNLYVKAGVRKGTLPRPRIHSTYAEYLRVLDRVEEAGMLRWSLISEEDEEYKNLANAIQLSLFADSKCPTRSRLISWPRVQNLALPDPPYTSIPNPSLFSSIELHGSNPSGYFLDVANMFHNIILPEWLTKLFPFKPVRFRDLAIETRQRIERQLGRQPPAAALIRPCQASMPMGFKWSVYISHTFVEGCLRQAYHMFRASRFAPPGIANLPYSFRAQESPFVVMRNKPLILHIIDDLSCVAMDWPAEAVRAWHRVTRRVLQVHQLPVSEKKSCPIEHVETVAVEFIGCTWDFMRRRIAPSTEKLNLAIVQSSALLHATRVDATQWLRNIGRLVWIATLNRPLLSCMKRVFSMNHSKHNAIHTLSEATKRELRTLILLLPFVYFQIGLPISTMVLAFDASLQAGAVTCTYLEPLVAQNLWNQVQTARADRALPHNTELPAVRSVATSNHWKRTGVHIWNRPEHINALEGSAAVMALECAVRERIGHARLILLTDSLVVHGALEKGRSSSAPLLARCRRFAALALAHGLRISMAFVRSENNPADQYTRF